MYLPSNHQHTRSSDWGFQQTARWTYFLNSWGLPQCETELSRIKASVTVSYRRTSHSSLDQCRFKKPFQYKALKLEHLGTSDHDAVYLSTATDKHHHIYYLLYGADAGHNQAFVRYTTAFIIQARKYSFPYWHQRGCQLHCGWSLYW